MSAETVRSSVALLSLTYGFGGGVGVGLAYVAPMSSAMKVTGGQEPAAARDVAVDVNVSLEGGVTWT